MSMIGRRPNTESALAKVHFELDPREWHGHSSESLWAHPLPKSRYRLCNTPFFAKGVSFEDVVLVKKIDGMNWFLKIDAESGHSTYRLILEKPINSEGFAQFWTLLQKQGCSYESGDIGMLLILAVDVPPKADINKVFNLLEAGEQAAIWDFEEGHCGHHK